VWGGGERRSQRDRQPYSFLLEAQYLQSGPKVGIQYVVYSIASLCVPTFGPLCIILFIENIFVVLTVCVSYVIRFVISNTISKNNDLMIITMILLRQNGLGSIATKK